MNDLISRKGVSAWLYNMGHEKLSEYVLDKKRFPSVDRPQGKWIYVTVEEWLRTGRDYGHHCSECDEINKSGKSNFCPNCGARMRGE